MLRSLRFFVGIMFATKYWLKETLVLIFLLAVVSTLVTLFIPFPYSYPISIGIVVFIVWLRRISKHADTLNV